MEEWGLRAQARVVHYIFTPGGAHNRAQKDQPGGMWADVVAPAGAYGVWSPT